MKKVRIGWKSPRTGKSGEGTMELSREDAEREIKRLQHDYPDMIHFTIEATDASAEPYKGKL